MPRITLVCVALLAAALSLTVLFCFQSSPRRPDWTAQTSAPQPRTTPRPRQPSPHPGHAGRQPREAVEPTDAQVIDKALADALKWLARRQRTTGAWRDKTGKFSPGVTALALLAFMEAGNSSEDGIYSGWMASGLEFLRSQQDSHGRIGMTEAEGWIYNHAISLLALARNCCLTKDAKGRKAVSKAAKYLLDVQNPGLGWKYEFRSGRNDTSVTCWAALALKEAHKSGAVEVPDSTFEGALNWLDRVTNTAGKAGYMRPGDDGSVIVDVNDTYEKYPSTTASALVIRMLSGQRRQDRKIMKGARLILESQPPQWFAGETLRVDLYYSFWAATAAELLLPFEKRKEWTSRLISSILSIQKTSGKDAGSFSPAGKWGMVGGRVYSTAMAALVLRHLRTDKPLDLTVEEHRRKRPENLAEAQPAEENEPQKEPEFKRMKGEPRTLEELAQVVNSTILTLSFHDTPLYQAVSFLRDITKVGVLVSGELSNADELTVTLRLRDLPFNDVLEVICHTAGGIDYGLYQTKKGFPVLLISTSEDIARRNLKKPGDIPTTLDCSTIKAKLPNWSCIFGLTTEEVEKVRRVEEKLKEKIGLDPRISTFGELWEFIERSSGLRVELSEEFLQDVPNDTPVNSGTKERSYAYVLQKIVLYSGFKYILSPNGIIFPSYATYIAMVRHASQKSREKRQSLKQVLVSKTVSVNFVKETFEKTIDSLRDMSELTFVLTAAAIEKTVDTTITLQVTDWRLDDALAEICRQAELTYEARPNYILIKAHSE